MRRQDGGAGRGARGREDVRTSRARAVPGPRPEALGPPARSSLMVRSPWLCPMLNGACPKGPCRRVLREGQQPPEARPGCCEDAAVARRRARVLWQQSTHIRKEWSAFWRATPSIFARVRKSDVGLPGAANNTGDEVCLSSPRRRGPITPNVEWGRCKQGSYRPAQILYLSVWVPAFAGTTNHSLSPHRKSD